MNKLLPLAVLSASILSGCATSPNELPTTYVSPLKYKKYDCDQLIEEMDHVSHRTANLYTTLDKKASTDSAQMGVGLLLLWPALFFLEGGDGPEATEYSNLKGEFKAIRTATVTKKCSTEFIPLSPEEIIKKNSLEQDQAITEDNDDDV